MVPKLTRKEMSKHLAMLVLISVWVPGRLDEPGCQFPCCRLIWEQHRLFLLPLKEALSRALRKLRWVPTDKASKFKTNSVLCASSEITEFSCILQMFKSLNGHVTSDEMTPIKYNIPQVKNTGNSKDSPLGSARPHQLQFYQVGEPHIPWHQPKQQCQSLRWNICH